MDIINAFEEISIDFQNYYGHERMLVITLFCVLLTYLYFPEIKRILIYPTLLIMALFLNPVMYELVFSKIIYWRMLWMIPGSYLIAYIICVLVRVGRTNIKK